MWKRWERNVADNREKDNDTIDKRKEDKAEELKQACKTNNFSFHLNGVLTN